MAGQSSSSSAARPWEPLKDRFLAWLQSHACSPGSPASVSEVWEMFVTDPWFVRRLRIKSRIAVAAGQLGEECVDDVFQEVVLLLRRQIEHTPDLHVNLEVIDRTFPAWISTRMAHACRDVVAQWKILDQLEPEAQRELLDLRRRRDVDAQIDFGAALLKLPVKTRAVLELYAKGLSLSEVAEQIGMTYWQAHREFRAGLEELRRLLPGHGR